MNDKRRIEKEKEKKGEENIVLEQSTEYGVESVNCWYISLHFYTRENIPQLLSPDPDECPDECSDELTNAFMNIVISPRS